METKEYYKSLSRDFQSACELIDSHKSHTELISMLKNGDIVQKQIAALELDTIHTKDEAQILINNITGQDGKVREAVSIKFAELAKYKNLQPFFNAAQNYTIFLDAVVDINGNICRNTISAIKNFQNDSEFCTIFCSELLERSYLTAWKVINFNLQDGKYKINKEIFKLYWYLETIYAFAKFIDLSKLKQILNITKSIEEYTIREKTAKILTENFNDEDLNNIRKLLKNDTNYYVRRF